MEVTHHLYCSASETGVHAAVQHLANVNVLYTSLHDTLTGQNATAGISGRSLCSYLTVLQHACAVYTAGPQLEAVRMADQQVNPTVLQDVVYICQDYIVLTPGSST